MATRRPEPKPPSADRQARRPAGSSAAASPEEAAAIVAAIERFMRATAAPPSTADETLEPWTRAAMLEGVRHEDHGDVPHPWINP